MTEWLTRKHCEDRALAAARLPLASSLCRVIAKAARPHITLRDPSFPNLRFKCTHVAVCAGSGTSANHEKKNDEVQRFLKTFESGHSEKEERVYFHDATRRWSHLVSTWQTIWVIWNSQPAVWRLLDVHISGLTDPLTAMHAGGVNVNRVVPSSCDVFLPLTLAMRILMIH